MPGPSASLELPDTRFQSASRLRGSFFPRLDPSVPRQRPSASSSFVHRLDRPPVELPDTRCSPSASYQTRDAPSARHGPLSRRTVRLELHVIGDSSPSPSQPRATRHASCEPVAGRGESFQSWRVEGTHLSVESRAPERASAGFSGEPRGSHVVKAFRPLPDLPSLSS